MRGNYVHLCFFPFQILYTIISSCDAPQNDFLHTRFRGGREGKRSIRSLVLSSNYAVFVFVRSIQYSFMLYSGC